MLVCGQINPPPVTTPGYTGVFLTPRDNMPAMSRAMTGTPLCIEHNGATQVGSVLHGWTDQRTGAMWALAEIDQANVRGAFAAAAVQHGAFKGFSLGYTSRVSRDPDTGRWGASDKRIVELSIVKRGAHEGCTIRAISPNT